MGGWKASRKGWRKLLPLVAAAGALGAFSADATARSEIDAFQSAVTTQSAQEALAFIADFGSSHLISDLIELLRPEVARDVCASLGRDVPRVHAACDGAAAAMPDAPAAPPQETVGPGADAPAASAARRVAARPAPLKANVAAAAADSKTAVAGQATTLISPAKAQAAKTPAAPVPNRATMLAAPAFVIVPGPQFRLAADPPPVFAIRLRSSAGPGRPPEDGFNVASTAPAADVERRGR